MTRKLATLPLLLGLAACSAKVTSDEIPAPVGAVSIEKDLSVGESNYQSNQIELDSSVSRGASIKLKFRSNKEGSVRALMGFAAGINCDLNAIQMKVHIDEDFNDGEAKDLPLTFPVHAGTDYKVRLEIPKNTCEALSFAIDAKYLAPGEITP